MTNSLAILERLFERECRSLAQYIGEAWPWMHAADRPAQDLIRSIQADERRWAGQLAEIITQRGGELSPGNYPDVFIHSNLHYVSLDYLAKRLADFLEPELATLRNDLSAMADDEPCRKLVEQMIERKTGQIAALRKLAPQDKLPA